MMNIFQIKILIKIIIRKKKNKRGKNTVPIQLKQIPQILRIKKNKMKRKKEILMI